MATLVLDPVTRLEGHLKIEVTLDSNNVVTEAKAAGNMFRDLENMLKGKVPKDAALLTQRICGVCPVSHATASAMAIEKILNFKPNQQALFLRNLINGTNFIASNILHFYHLTLMDFIQGPQMNPWTPGYTQDMRFSQTDTAALIDNYVKALAIRRKAQEMGAIFGGKLPHVGNLVPGGVTSLPSSQNITDFNSYLSEITAFIKNEYEADVNKVASTYSDYYNIGKGYGNLITYGAFDIDTNGGKLMSAGTVTNGVIESISQDNIKEYVGHCWYSSPSGQNPASGTTTASYPKSDAYTWIKAPRYNEQPYETGPLARTWISGDYKQGVSVMDRHMARYIETAKLADNMLTWINQVVPQASAYTNVSTPVSGSGSGLTDAPRGALGHWVSVSSSKISGYQVITPTCWNASPMDDNGNPGPMEKALIGIQVADINQPIELLRIVHSFDPCLACSVHVMTPEGVEMSKFIVQPIGG